MEKLLTVEEAATVLRCEVSTIRRRIQAGLILAYRNGKGFLIPESGIAGYLEANRSISKALGRPFAGSRIGAAPVEKHI